MEAVDEDEAARLTALVEQLLRERRGDPNRCCRTGCLHCPTAREMAWRGRTDRST